MNSKPTKAFIFGMIAAQEHTFRITLATPENSY